SSDVCSSDLSTPSAPSTADGTAPWPTSVHSTDGSISPISAPTSSMSPDTVRENMRAGVRGASTGDDPLAVDLRDRGQPLLRIRMLGVAPDLLGRSDFDDPSGLHRGHPVGDLPDDGEVMADEEHRGTRVDREGSHHPCDPRLQERIE